MKDKIDIIYFGHGLTGLYGIQRLKKGKLKDKVNIKAVVISDKNKDQGDLVKHEATSYGIKTYDYPLHSEQLQDYLTKKTNVDLGIIMNFDQKIPQNIINLPTNGMWNVHQSDLPKYRGGLPLESIIVNGDNFRVSVHELTKNFDDGDIIYQSQPIDVWGMDIDELYFFSSKQSALALEDSLKLYLKGDCQPTKQDNSKATYANAKDLNNLLKIDWQNDCGEDIFRKVLAGGINRGAISSLNIHGKEEQFRITEANFIPANINHSYPLSGTLSKNEDCYAVRVNDGTVYISGIQSQNSQVIHTLNSADKNMVVLS
jgi:methionyl-tRNA formyltransferase